MNEGQRRRCGLSDWTTGYCDWDAYKCICCRTY